MELREYIGQKKEIYQHILSFIEIEYENEDFKSFYEEIRKLSIIQKEENHDEIVSFLRLIHKISNNYHRTSYFDTKIQQILKFIFNDHKETLTNSEIFDIFKNNKRILLFLIHNKILTIDQNVLNFILDHDTHRHFFYPEIKSQLSEEERQIEEEKLLAIDQDIFNTFDQKRQKGENDSYICSLIQEDQVVEFIQYVNQNKISLSSILNVSIFETNSFLLKNKTSLIEYSAFYGSIQIFNFLRMNNVELNDSLWLYVIHSKNASLIHILEECIVKPNEITYQNAFIESIKCHHNDIATYIQDNLLDQNENENKNKNLITSNILKYYNYFFLTEELDREKDFYSLCKYKHSNIVNFLLIETEKKVKNKTFLESDEQNISKIKNHFNIVFFLNYFK